MNKNPGSHFRIKVIIGYYHDSLDKMLKSLFRNKKYVQHQPNQFQQSLKPEGYNSHNNPGSSQEVSLIKANVKFYRRRSTSD